MAIWAEIEGVEGKYGKYEVSDEGDVRQMKRYEFKPPVLVDGEWVFRFHIGGKIVQRNAKKLVETYHGTAR